MKNNSGSLLIFGIILVAAIFFYFESINNIM